MLLDTQLSKLQHIQDTCIKLIDCRKNNNDLGILKISDILELEKLKFCYNYLHDAIPLNISTCIGTDPYGNSLIKNHSYNTRNKLVLNILKAYCSLYNKSIFCTYSASYIRLPAKIKQCRSVSQFVRSSKNWIQSR